MGYREGSFSVWSIDKFSTFPVLLLNTAHAQGSVRVATCRSVIGLQVVPSGPLILPGHLPNLLISFSDGC